MDAEMKYLHTDGTPARPGICMMPDHHVQTFTLTVRSLRPLSSDRLKEIIETKEEVVACERTSATCYITNSK